MKRVRPAIVYQDRRCWWCGTRLAETGVVTVIDRLGHPHPVHGANCEDSARQECRVLTAHPRQGPFYDPG